MADDVVMELLACRAKKQARQRAIEHAKLRLSQLGADDRLAVTRARKLECFLTNPFFVAEGFTGIPGQRVPLAQTIRGCNMIMDGELDSVDERKLAYIGEIDEAFKAGEPVKY
jgi:F0F1-type ATP synthase beta subunit